MAPAWGWALPEGAAGRGRGARAFARRLVTGAAAHDASYWCPFLLSGPALRAALAAVLGAEAAAAVAAAALDAAAPRAARATLHRAGAWPRGALGPLEAWPLPPGAGAPRPGLLLWAHAAAAAEAFAELRGAADAAGAALRVLNLRRLEVRGGGADAALAAALAGAPLGAGAALPAALRTLPAAGAAHVLLLDPRLARPVEVGSATGASYAAAEPPAGLALLGGGALPAPASDAAIGAQRAAARAVLLHLDAAYPGVEAAPGAAEATAAAAAEEESIAASAFFPALAVRRGGSAPGWALALPPGRAPPLWRALAAAGAAPAGQREWRWAHTLAGAPFFPHDAPDAPAAAAAAARRAAAAAAAAAARPNGRRAPAANVAQPDWAALCAPSPAAADSAKGSGAAPMEVDAPPQQLEPFVARSEAAVAAALWGVEGAAPLAAAGARLAARPVRAALAAGTLRWAPVASAAARPPAAAACLVQARVAPVRRGAPAEGAALVLVDGAGPAGTAPLHVRGAGFADEEQESFGAEPIDPARISVIGYVTSPAPPGAPRAAPSLAACSAAALWRLRGAQHVAARRDRGAVSAWLRNPGGGALFAVRVAMLVEAPDADAAF